MTIDLVAAMRQLNMDNITPGDAIELQLYVDAANQWIAKRVTDTTPAPVTLGALFLVDHLWQSQRGPAGTPLSDETITVTGVGYAVPNRVLELIDPYRSRATPTYSFPDAVGHPDPVEATP